MSRWTLSDDRSGSVICLKCHRNFRDFHAVKDHLDVSRMHNWCAACHRDFSSSADLSDHECMHELRESFMCNRCNTDLFCEAYLALHLEDSPFHWLCPHSGCTYDGFNEHNLLEHYRATGHGFPCEGCPATYHEILSLREHLHLNHGCQLCCSHFPNAQELLDHYRGSGHRQVCKDCSRVYRSMARLIAHLEYAKACEGCHKHHDDEQSLSRHRYACHTLSWCTTIPRPVGKCRGEGCPMEFASKDLLDFHYKACAVCTMCFEHHGGDQKALEKHQETAHGLIREEDAIREEREMAKSKDPNNVTAPKVPFRLVDYPDSDEEDNGNGRVS